jgi:glycosyltransferase involved in cell wall biosynthesis
MTGSQRSILIDARLNAWPGAQGPARSVLKLTEHMGLGQDVLALRVLVNRSDPQLFPLAGLSEWAELVDTDIGPTAMHRSRELGRLIRDVGAAVFYAPHPLFAPAICACPMVVGVHGCASYGSAARARPWHRRFLLRAVTAKTLRLAAAVAAPTKAGLAELLRHYPAVARPTLIPNGVEVSQFAGVTGRAVTAARLRYGLREPFILTVGSHRPHNDYGVLIRALALMPPTVSLVIVGYSEPYFGDLLRQQISDLGMGSRVRLVPAVTDEALPAVYRAASVFAYPSLEGYGLPVLEAMSAGVPVVASALPALKEVCGSAALLVPPHDPTAWATAITRVLNDPATASDLVAAGAAVASTATWDRGGKALRELLSSVTDSS